MFLGRRLISDGLWVAAGQVLSAVAVIASIRVLTEFLAPAEYGLMALILATASTIVGLAIGVVGEGILVNYSRFERAYGAAAFRKASAEFSLLIYGITIAVILSVGFILASVTEVDWRIPLLVVGILTFDSLRYFELMLFTAARRQRAAAIVHVSDAWLRLVASWLALILFHADAYTALAGNLAGSAIVLVIIRLALHPIGLGGPATEGAQRKSEIQAEFRRLFPILLPAKLLGNIFEIGSRYVVVFVLGLGAAGIYSACNGLARRPFGMLNSISDWTMKPILAQTLAEHDGARAARIRLYWSVAIAVLSFIGVSLIYLLREPIVALLLGDGYEAAVDIMPIMAIGVGIFTAANVLNSIMIVEGKPRAALHSNLAKTVVGLGATLLLSWLYGLEGAAWGLVAGFVAFGAIAFGNYWVETRSDMANRIGDDR